MDTSRNTIELLRQIGEIARDLNMSNVSVSLGSDFHVVVNFHPPTAAPPKPLTQAEEHKIRVQNARNELEMTYAHTGHRPSDEEVLEFMAMRGDT